MDYSTYNYTDCVALLEEKDSILERQDRKIQRLEFELEQLKRMIYGSKSERFVPAQSPAQLPLFDLGQESDIETPQQEVVVRKKKGKKKKPVRQKLPDHLERQEQRILPDIDVSTMKCIGEEITEKLEVTPAQAYVRKIVRPKYVDRQGQIHIASLPSDPFPKCIAGASLAAEVAVHKYVDHQPLYRQRKMYARQDIYLASSTVNDIIKRGAHLIRSVYDALREMIMQSDYLMADESSIRVLNKDNAKGSIKGCMLIKVAPKEKMVVMEYIRTKEKIHLTNSLKEFKGHLQVDGNVSYEALGDLDHIELMHCLAHSRRYFEKAVDYDEEKASYVLSLIQKLYFIERKAQENNLDQEAIYEIRQKQSIPILDKLKEWLHKHAFPDEPPNPLQKAITYMLKRWDGLTKYTTDGKFRPDNNLIENQIRPLALGRKNYMFAGSHEGAQYAATFYSLFATCQMNGIDPLAWLTDVYKRIPDHPINQIKDLLPLKSYKFLDR